jgi:hypothetical protein
MARINGSVGTSRGFSKAVNKFVQETPERISMAKAAGLKDFRDALLAATPIDTGNLRASLQTSPQGGITAGPYKEYGSEYNTSTSNSVIDSLPVDGRVSFVYRAPYARRLEYGFTGIDSIGRNYNQAGRYWIRSTSARFVSIMRAAANRFKNT